MSSMSWLSKNLSEATTTSTEFLRAHREHLSFEADQRAQQRRTQLTEQRSNLNAPNVRIRIWEKVHELRLPLDPMHGIVDVVAAATGLTLSQVRQEQQVRRATQAVPADEPAVTA
jgi:hypothetical protein